MKMKYYCFVYLFFTGINQGFSQTDSTMADSLLLKQISGEIGAVEPAPQQIRTSATANPDISVIGDFSGEYINRGKKNVYGGLKEAEFSFQSVVDPYIRADFYYSAGQDLYTGEFSSEIEEGFLTTLSLPAHLQLKAGRFKQAIGRVNPLHSHALPFINMPDAYVSYFGEEGLKGDGLSLSWLLPNHLFYQELTFQVTQPVDGFQEFQRSSTNKFLLLAHLKNFWDLSDNSTLELGLTGMNGENAAREMSTLGAVDITYKWKPLRYNTYKSITFQNELFFSRAKAFTRVYETMGFYSLLNVQISKRWFVGGRYDYTNPPFDEKFVKQSGTITLGWYATEFQKLEFEVKQSYVNAPVAGFSGERNATQAFLRWIFIIGTHGAHQY